MKYIVSRCGFNIAVGLLDEESAIEDINLAHNIYDAKVNNNYYNGVIIFDGLRAFYRFLINKYYLAYWTPNKSERQVLKYASNMTRTVLNNQTKYENFMPQIYQHTSSTKQIYRWHDPKYNLRSATPDSD